MVKYHQMFKTYKYSNSTHFKEQIKVSNDFYFILWLVENLNLGIIFISDIILLLY